jgi:hypothetical protein
LDIIDVIGTSVVCGANREEEEEGAAEDAAGGVRGGSEEEDMGNAEKDINI